MIDSEEILKIQLFDSIRNNDIEKLLMIFKLGINVNTKDDFGRTPVFLAALYNNLSMVKKLADLGADLEMKNNLEYTILSKIASKDNPYKKISKEEQLAIVKLLIKRGAKLTTRSHNALPIHTAIQARCSLDIVTTLLTEDIVNEKDNFGYAPLHLAVLTNRIDIVKLLLMYKHADINIRYEVNNNKHKYANINIWNNVHQDTPLIMAARNNREDIVTLLLACGANKNLKNSYGQGFLNFASQKDTESCKLTTIESPPQHLEPQNKSFVQPCHSNDYSYAQHQILEKRPQSIRSILADLGSMCNKSFNPDLPTSDIYEIPQSIILNLNSSIPIISQLRMLYIGSPEFSTSRISQSSTSAILGSPKSTISEVSQCENMSSPGSSISEVSLYGDISSPGSSISEAHRRINISPLKPPFKRRSSIGSSSVSSSPGSYAIDDANKRQRI